MTKLLTSSWMTLPVSVVVYLAATLLFWKTPVPSRIVGPDEAAAAAPSATSWEFTNPESEQLMAELKAEKKSLAKREQDLNDLSARLDTERSELTLVTQSVHQMQTDFDKNVVRVQDEETANLKKLAKVYSAMAPENAAGILSQLDDIAVAKIMVFMKDGDTAGIFEAMAKKGPADSKRAAALSERLRLSTSRNNTAK